MAALDPTPSRPNVTIQTLRLLRPPPRVAAPFLSSSELLLRYCFAMSSTYCSISVPVASACNVHGCSSWSSTNSCFCFASCCLTSSSSSLSIAMAKPSPSCCLTFIFFVVRFKLALLLHLPHTNDLRYCFVCARTTERAPAASVSCRLPLLF
uniref:Uncharacterized protein n=1 Tax=Nicotiana tabacum TaxID=4097 RepID=A0A1S3YDX0_TOBAC|nr:PREDICTED: uncharacterized protein LOC107775234 [Nicotiana tabacum]